MWVDAGGLMQTAMGKWTMVTPFSFVLSWVRDEPARKRLLAKVAGPKLPAEGHQRILTARIEEIVPAGGPRITQVPGDSHTVVGHTSISPIGR